MRKPLLNTNAEETDERTPLLNDGDDLNISRDSLTDSELEDAKDDFIENLGKNRRTIFEVKSYPVNDRESKVKRSTIRAFTMNEIKVISMDLEKHRGFVDINNGEIDMPLRNIKRNEKGPWFFYNKSEALKKATALNKVEFDYVKEQADEFNAAREYLQELIDNERI